MPQLYERKPTAKSVKAHVQNGGTLIHRGVVIRDVEQVPTAVELAKTNEDKQVAVGDLEAQRARLDAQIAAAKGGKGDNKENDKEPKTPDPPAPAGNTPPAS